jgi:phage gp16-like protein
MKCKICHPIFGNRLRQSGLPDPKSYECVIHGKEHLHNDEGKPYTEGMPAAKVEIKISCPKCGSEDVKRMMLYSYKCNKCSTFFTASAK